MDARGSHAKIFKFTAVPSEKDIILLKYICVGSPTPSRWVTFYPRTVFFPSSASAEEIPQEFVNHFRGGFLHDVSAYATFLKLLHAEDGAHGIGSQEVRISSFRVHGSRFLHVKADAR